MSKAFTREADGDTDAADADEPRDLLGGARNLVTPRGLGLLRDELHALRHVERPKIVEIVSWAAGNGDRSENGDYIYGKKRLREIDRRLRYLGKRIESAEVVDPNLQKNRAQVFFGATVTYATVDDGRHTVTLVGIDEADADAGRINWVSPVAKALLKARVGDTVKVRTPTGDDEIEVMAIEYPRIGEA
jgi:transcription elongation factor GreB